MMIIYDDPEHVFMLCLRLCSDVGVVCVRVRTRAAVCFVCTPVRAERMFMFGQRCSLPALPMPPQTQGPGLGEPGPVTWARSSSDLTTASLAGVTDSQGALATVNIALCGAYYINFNGA